MNSADIGKYGWWAPSPVAFSQAVTAAKRTASVGHKAAVHAHAHGEACNASCIVVDKDGNFPVIAVGA